MVEPFTVFAWIETLVIIKKLFIKNIGGIKEAELSFTPGLNVITGESGAGKSSVVRALELLTGTRGGVKFIRAGEVRAQVEACLDDSVISREILSNGRSRAKIDGENISLNDCSKAVNSLIRIQNQFAQLELLDAEKQLAMIDSCLPEKIKEDTFKNFHEIFEKARASAAELREIKKRRAEIERQYSNAREIFELVKISKPESGLEIRLENLLADITHRIAKREKARENFDALTGGLSEQGLISNTESRFEELFDFMSDEEKKEIQLSFENLYAAAKNLSGIFNRNDDEKDSAKREEIETRLGALRKLKRLCNIPDENELLNYCDEIYKNLEWLEKSYKDLESLSARSLDEKKKANALALEIRRARHDAAVNLEKRVNEILEELAMLPMTFKINFSGLQKLNRNGADSIEFILSDGSREGRLEKIASGGELSRLLLALQLSLPEEWLPPVIVFDEVEAGLGGKAAVLSGMQLKKLSQKCQVILVTHEASIAALGDNHIFIQRNQNETLMKNISGEERVKEIARMLSGAPDMAEALEHAKKLIINR